MRPTLDQAIFAVHQLPKLPGTTGLVLGYLADDNADIDKIVQAIARDQGLVAKVLRVANSPFFGMSNQIYTIHDAVIVLGYSNLKSILIATLIKTQNFPGLINTSEIKVLFRHALLVGVCASEIARINKLNQNQFFLIGVLHDVGKLALMSAYPREYTEVLRIRIDESLKTTEAEEKIFGFNHATIGGLLCRHWLLPEDISTAVLEHHSFDSEMQASKKGFEHYKFAEITHLADYLASVIDTDFDISDLTSHIHPDILSRWIGNDKQLSSNLKQIKESSKRLSFLEVLSE